MQEADWYLDTAIILFSKIENLDVNYFNDINNIALSNYNFGEYRKLFKLSEILIRMAFITKDITKIVAAKKFNFYASYKENPIGNYDSQIKELMDLEEMAYKKDSISKITSYNDWGSFYTQLNDTFNAIRIYKKAIQLASLFSAKDSMELNFNFKIAKLRLEKGNVLIAAKWLENETYRIEKKQAYNELEKEILESYLLYLDETKDTVKAAQHCQYWLNLYANKDVLKDVYWTIKRGDSYSKINDLNRREYFYKVSESKLLKKYDANHMELVLTYAKLGNIYYQKNQYERALPYFKKLIDIEEERCFEK